MSCRCLFLSHSFVQESSSTRILLELTGMYCTCRAGLSTSASRVLPLTPNIEPHRRAFSLQECIVLSFTRRAQPQRFTSYFNALPSPPPPLRDPPDFRSHFSRRLDRRRVPRCARNRATVDGYTKRAAASTSNLWRQIHAHLASSTFDTWKSSTIQLLRVRLKTPGPEDAGATSLLDLSSS